MNVGDWAWDLTWALSFRVPVRIIHELIPNEEFIVEPIDCDLQKADSGSPIRKIDQVTKMSLDEIMLWRLEN